MKDHRPNYVLRITPLKLMDLLWSLISDLSSANLVSGKKSFQGWNSFCCVQHVLHGDKVPSVWLLQGLVPLLFPGTAGHAAHSPDPALLQ